MTFVQYDLGYFDDETCRLEPIEKPFGPKVLHPLGVGIKCEVNSIRRRNTICDWRRHGCALVEDVVERAE